MDKIERGRQAQLILESPAYREAQQKLLQDIRSLRLGLTPKDVDGAHKLVLMEQAVEKARYHLESYMHEGEAARKELEREVYPGPLGRLNARIRRVS